MVTPGKNLERLIVIPAVALLAVSIIPGSASVVTDLIWPPVSAVDPEKVFLWITIHHILQLAFTVLVMKFVFRMDLHQSGFNLNELTVSLRIFGWFALVFLGWRLLEQLPYIISRTAPSLGYPLNAKNMAGVLGFQFLLSGTAEEPLFRGLVMIVLGKYLKGTHRIGKLEIPSAGIVATVLFMLAHVSFTFSPFAIQYSLYQQFLALGLGLYYAIVFHRTGSLLAPIIAHGYSNGILYLFLYSRAFLFS